MSALDALAERLAGGAIAAEADARLILETRDLIAAGTIADDVRRRLHGTRATFVRVMDVHVEAPPTGRPPEVLPGEVRLVGRPSSLDAAVAGVRAAVALAGGVPVTGFSLADLLALAPQPAEFDQCCHRLAAAGLAAIAEVPLDLVGGAAEAVTTARHTGLAVLRMTIHDKAADDPLALLLRARDLQTRVGGFAALAPLPRRLDAAAPTTGYDDVKLVAAARVLAGNIPSIQVDWVQYGPKLAQVALTMGADDVDGVLPGPGVLGPRRSPLEEIRRNITAAGFEPAERTGLFAPLEHGEGTPA